MTLKLDRYDWMSFTVLGAALVATLASYSLLPEQVPIHFTLEGHANGWATRPLGSLLLPGAALLLWGLLRAGPAFLPDDWRERMTASPMSIVAFCAVVLLALMQGGVLFASLHPGEVRGWMFLAAIGGYSVVLGQLMPRIRRNPWVGVRTPFTLSSDENWLRTHRFAGYSMSIGGLAAIALAAISPSLSIAAFLAGVILPVIYSYVLARRLPPPEGSAAR